MARGGINKALVKQARQALLARGENPSLDALRIELGNTGSKTTIHRYLKELEAAETGRSSAVTPLSDQLTGLVAQLAERLQDEANATVAQAHERWTQERTEHVDRLRQTETRVQQLETHTEALEGHLKEQRQAHQQAQQQLQQAQVEHARLLQARQDLDTRLADRDEQIRSLEEKHQHARDSLEHYRRTSQEQREQEQRRHETQVQQLQMETRQLQQTLIVKQDELTQLNRDNERLLTEARLLRREQHAQQGQLEHQSHALDGLRAAVAQAEGAKAALEEHSQNLQAEVSRLIESNTVQAQQALSLQERLAESTTQLELMRHVPSSKDPAS